MQNNPTTQFLASCETCGWSATNDVEAVAQFVASRHACLKRDLFARDLTCSRNHLTCTVELRPSGELFCYEHGITFETVRYEDVLAEINTRVFRGAVA